MGTFKAHQAAFDTYDPSMFDPNLAGKYNNANGAGASALNFVQTKAGQKMTFSVTLNNPAAVSLWFELFCFLNSFTNVLNTQYVKGNYKYIPLLSLEGLTAHAGTHGGVVGFDQTGTLQIQGDLAVPEASGTIGCSEIAYKGLFEASGITPFMVTGIRFTCKTDAQIDNNITYFTQSYSGGRTQNPIKPRTYFNPDQFQNFTLDLPVQCGIDIQSGLNVLVNAGETLSLNFFVSVYSDQSSS